MAEPLQKTTVVPDVSSSEPSGVDTHPPPDSPKSVWTRRIIIFAFWAVVATLGLPHWIWTTSIYRSDLPVEQMARWSEGHACQLQYPIHIVLDSPSIPIEHLETVALALETGLNLDDGSSFYDFKVSPGSVSQNETDETALTISLVENAKQKSGNFDVALQSMSTTLEVKHGPIDASTTMRLAAFLLEEVKGIFRDEQASVAYLLRDSSFSTTGKNFQLKPEATQAIEKRTTRAFKYSSTYHVTFSLFAASSSPSVWDIEEAVQQYIQPLLRQLSPISNFQIDTQVQLFASFSPSIAGPHFDEQTKSYRLLQSDLSGFINAAEWPLSPSIGPGPTINMVLYIPSPSQNPLLLETGGTSWTIPQWGGVQIFNPPTNQSTTHLSTPTLQPLMLTFADQLLSLLGVPTSPPSLALQISSLKRQRTTSLLLSASSTLGALVRLTRKLESIAIPPSVATSVDQSLTHLDRACTNLRRGAYQAALEHARGAEAEAEKAFFEPSMVGQVYFPDEHKVAVYVPLLGPMAVPLVMSALKEVKNWRAGRKVKTL